MEITVVTCTCREKSGLDYLAGCLLNQTFKNFEWVIVDRILDSRNQYLYLLIDNLVCRKFPIRVVKPKWSIFHDFNLPAVANARNSGLLEANGKLVVFVDDNMWVPSDFLQKHYNIYLLGLEHEKKYQGVGLHWPFTDWNTVEELSKREPYTDGKFCRNGTWEDNNKDFDRDKAGPRDDARCYLHYPWPDGRNTVFLRQYEVIGGAWCYSGNMSVRLEDAFAVNGFDEDFDGSQDSEDIDFGLRLNNYGVTILLDRSCVAYEYKHPDNTPINELYNFKRAYIAEVNGHKMTKGQFKHWAVMRSPSWYMANAHFDLTELKQRFRKETARRTFV